MNSLLLWAIALISLTFIGCSGSGASSAPTTTQIETAAVDVGEAYAASKGVSLPSEPATNAAPISIPNYRSPGSFAATNAAPIQP